MDGTSAGAWVFEPSFVLQTLQFKETQSNMDTA